jgi:hypothetical protein
MTMIFTPRPQDVRTAANSRCAFIERSLRDYDQIKIGGRRKDVPRAFQHGGGTQFPSAVRYTYSESQYIHVDVEYETDPSAKVAFSPEDVIRRKSKLYIDHEARD